MGDLLLVGISLAAGVLLGALLSYYLLRAKSDPAKVLLNQLPEHLKTASEQLLLLAKEKLSTDKDEIKTDLSHKKELIRSMVEEIRKELLKAQERLQKSEQERLEGFAALKKELEQHQLLTSELRGSTEDLKKLLANNQLRGQFGEQVAENLLKMAGFVVGQDYFVNQAQDSVRTRPDFTLVLPDKTKINIDVKFPYQALQKMTETEDREQKKKYSAEFARDVREKIKQVCSRDYINPEEGTVDFVVLFIPNEMIFSFVYEQLNSVWQEAMEKKVVMAGPFSFTAILRLIKQAHSNFAFSQNLHQVLGLIQKFRQEYGKFSESIDVLGKRLDSAREQFIAVSTTRDRQLNRVIDQIESQPAIEEKRPELTE